MDNKRFTAVVAEDGLTQIVYQENIRWNDIGKGPIETRGCANCKGAPTPPPALSVRNIGDRVKILCKFFEEGNTCALNKKLCGQIDGDPNVEVFGLSTASDFLDD